MKMRRVAIVTGGAQGIGRATCLRLLSAGWHVAAFDRDAEALDALEPNQRLTTLIADVADERAVGHAFAVVRERLGEALDLLVNNAGPAGPVSGPVEKLSLDGWRTWIDGHLTGAFLMTRQAVPMLRRRRGSIVNVASTRAFMSEPDCEAYAAAKGGLVALTHALAVSLGPEVRANGIAPGWIDVSDWKKPSQREPAELREIDHAQHPAGRVGRPDDVAEAVLYLAGAGFVTGQTLVVDGGMTRKMIYAE